MTTTQPSALILPFGKHKGKTVAEVVETDPQYVDWVTSQGWLADRFAELYSAFITKGAQSDETPEHNDLQRLFLNVTFQVAVAMAAGLSIDIYPDDCKFEFRGIDFAYNVHGYPDMRNRGIINYSGVGVEIKPSLGDDYPAVMRQMARLSTPSLNCQILLIKDYCGKGATLDEVRAMFDMNGRVLITLKEVKAKMRAAKKRVDSAP